MSIRLIDEIYSALHNGEKPPYTNARGPLNMDSIFSGISMEYYEELLKKAFSYNKSFWFVPADDMEFKVD